jgi:hypothetical protein
LFHYKIGIMTVISPNEGFTTLQIPSFVLLGATAQGELWPPQQSASILLYSEADSLVSELFNFYGVRLLASCPTTKLEDQGIPLRLAPTP